MASDRRDYNRKYYQEHKEHILSTNKKYRQEHKEQDKRWRATYTKKHYDEIRQIHWKRKLKVVEMLGGKCRRCGEMDIRVLQVNHINGGGRRDPLGKTDLYLEIVQGRRPIDDLELLCANCNIIYEYEVGHRRVYLPNWCPN